MTPLNIVILEPVVIGFGDMTVTAILINCRP